MPGKKRSTPSQPPAKLLTALTRRGPHRVLKGDLGLVGTPGRVYAPAEGERLPAIAFGHGWLAAPDRYHDLCCHLASWGIVVALPAGERGLLASDTGLAAQMRAALSIVTRVPLGFGSLTVDPRAVGYAGHGFGAAAAVIAASDEILHAQEPHPVRGVAALFPAPTTSLLLPMARRVTAPGMIVSALGELDAVDGNALPLALAYGADAPAEGETRTSTGRRRGRRGADPEDKPQPARPVLWTPPGATSRGLMEHRTIASLIGSNGADKKTHRAVRALTTGFFLHTLTGDDDYRAFADAGSDLGKISAVDLDDPPQNQDKMAKLLGVKERRRRRASSPVPTGAPNILVPAHRE